MRKKFIDDLINLATVDENVFLITGDLGYNLLEAFEEALPNQFINVGIAEQNMIGIATGLALEGKVVFVYSIGNFPSLRCLEQIRNDAAYHNANVKIVSVGGGLSYGAAGMSHHATEDTAIIRALPNVKLIYPSDVYEMEELVKRIYDLPGVFYLKLGKNSKTIHDFPIKFSLGKAININEGEDIALFSNGEILEEAYLVTKDLNQMNISTALYSFPTIKPIDTETILKCAKRFKLIVTIEEGNIIGGFGSAVAEILSELNDKLAIQIRVGLQDQYTSVVGDREYLRNYYGLSKETIICKILKALK